MRVYLGGTHEIDKKCEKTDKRPILGASLGGGFSYNLDPTFLVSIEKVDASLGLLGK